MDLAFENAELVAERQNLDLEAASVFRQRTRRSSRERTME